MQLFTSQIKRSQTHRMTLIQFKGENVRPKNIIKFLGGLKLSGLMPTVNYISYFDSTLDESCSSVELTCRDGGICHVALTHRHIVVSESDNSQSLSAHSSMATERERSTLRKTIAPHRLIEDDMEETGNVLCHLYLFHVDIV